MGLEARHLASLADEKGLRDAAGALRLAAKDFDTAGISQLSADQQTPGLAALNRTIVL